MGSSSLHRSAPLDQRYGIAIRMTETRDDGKRSARRLLQTDFINRQIDLRPALKRAAVERYWLEQMAAAEAEEQK
jgi:hypothetical protein